GPDLAVANHLGNDVSVLLNQGDGTFAAAVAYAAGAYPYSVAIGDLDGVNGPDLAVASFGSNELSVLLNQGDGTFAAAMVYDAGSAPVFVAIGDLDGMNGPDIVVVTAELCGPWGCSGTDGVSVLLNQGAGTLAAAAAYAAGDAPQSVAIGVLDEVNGPDVAVLNLVSADVSVLLNQGDGTFPGSGTEADPFCSIQTAIDNAVDTDEIVVAPGTYFERINLLGKAVTLRSSDGPEVTVIDAQQTGTVVTCDSGEGPDTILDGFTITNGEAAAGYGSGMFNENSCPTVINCTFTGNEAEYGGGGMYNTNSSPTVIGCAFSANTAHSGGGMCNVVSAPTVTDCTFSGNAVWGFASYGGGIYNQESSPAVTRCTFTGNSAGGGGAIFIHARDLTIVDSAFIGNTALYGAGAVMGMDSTNTIINCAFHDNAGTLGGALAHADYLPPSEPLLLLNCSFVNNSATDGAGALHLQSTSAVVMGCTVLGNHAGPVSGKGGGIWNVGPNDFALINCTLAGNTADGAGGGIADDDGSGQVQNCILWANAPDQVAGTPDMGYSNVQGGFTGPGNIDADPLFVDPDNGDYRLSPGSPCIDAGDNTAVPDGITTDLDGNPRFVDDPDTADTGNGDPPLVDMGAYELQPCPWDLSGNGNVDVTDLLMVIASWGPCPGCPADFNDDGLVNVVDLLALIGHWGPCPGVPCVWDVNGDGVVDQADLQQVLDNMGLCDGCPEDVNGDSVVNGRDAAAVARHFGPCP
ncbi:MAG: right-handed parallel beta-helix repeat-containing protein, partial [Planctomycetota bacterium]